MPIPRARDPMPTLIQDLITSSTDLPTLASRHFPDGDPFEQLASWSRDASVRRTLVSLCELADLHARLTIAQGRLEGAEALRRQVRDGASDEQARRAGVDLLRAMPWSPLAGAPQAGIDEACGPDPVDFGSMLERLGAMTEPAPARVEVSVNGEAVDH